MDGVLMRWLNKKVVGGEMRVMMIHMVARTMMPTQNHRVHNNIILTHKIETSALSHQVIYKNWFQLKLNHWKKKAWKCLMTMPLLYIDTFIGIKKNWSQPGLMIKMDSQNNLV